MNKSTFVAMSQEKNIQKQILSVVLIEMKVVILENIRSAYNVGNIIRTADALGWQVWLSGYTPSPQDNSKVVKTSLGAELHV
ncbi:hypothetical protein KKG31_03975 [Patescibacteria group bacterium]|nr:hypothetical protein [Patescibacteria group bacterium]MBU1758300.1 hypothetical protein [Patescibacteria group bacterium]